MNKIQTILQLPPYKRKGSDGVKNIDDAIECIFPSEEISRPCLKLTVYLCSKICEWWGGGAKKREGIKLDFTFQPAIKGDNSEIGLMHSVSRVESPRRDNSCHIVRKKIYFFISKCIKVELHKVMRDIL